ncbi:NADP-dependent oxidoreductase domain-containing protein, partial [Pavlovales sp. CCMP2436]
MPLAAPRRWALLALLGALRTASEPRGEPSGPPATDLLSGAQMPLLGFGCAGRLGAGTLREAARLGYTLFDTAQAHEWYDEAALGEALAGGPRVFVTTKVHPRDFGAESTAAALERSLARLRVGVIDLVMLHYPNCWGQLCAGSPPPEGDWRAAWRALERGVAEGKVLSLGVSNFGVAELAQLWGNARVKPAVVQSWMDPFSQNREVRAWCEKKGVVFQAYSTLGTQHRTGANPVLSSALLARIAADNGRSVAQVVLRWALSRGAAVLPRSSNPARMRENLHLFDFELSPAELAQIDSLGMPPPL